jgi:hypothetical protein
MRGVALSILVIGLALVAIILAYLSFGHIGSNFSTGLIAKQNAKLREQFGLPPQPWGITNETELLIPPSLRNISVNNDSS